MIPGLKHSNTRRGKTQLSRLLALCLVRTQRAADRQTEPSSPLRPPAPEWTNTNRSLNMQTEKYVKEPNSAPARGVLCAQGARRETCLKALEHRICLFLLLYRKIHTKLSKYPSWRVSSKKLSVMSYVKVNSWERNRMCIIILDALSLKVTAPNLLELSVSLMLIQENERKKNTHCSWLNYFVVLTRINPQSNQKLFRHQV